MGDIDSVFAERLKEVREKRGLSLTGLSKLTDVKVQSLSTYEATGPKRKTPTIANAARLAAALGVSLDWLCGLTRSERGTKLESYGDATSQILDLGEQLYKVQIESAEKENYVAVVLYDSVLGSFFREYDKMRSLLHKEKVITEELFDLWLSDRMNKLNNLPLKMSSPYLDYIEQTEGADDDAAQE